MRRLGRNLMNHNRIAAAVKIILLQTLVPSARTSSRKIFTGSLDSSTSLSIWRRKKDIGKEGLIVAKELKRLQGNSIQLERFIKSHVSRLLKSDLVAVLAEFQRQNLVFLSMKVSFGIFFSFFFLPLSVDLSARRDFLFDAFAFVCLY